MTSTSKFSESTAVSGAEPAVGGPGNGRNHGPELANLPQRQPPSLADACHLHGKVPMPPQVSTIVHQGALRQIQSHAISNLRTELGGALLGKAYQHNGTLFVEIEAALPATSGDHGPIHFTFSADSWRQLQVDKEEHYPQLDIVGWFHTHPGLGVFYSGDDVVVHSAAFTLPWHVGLVVDPIRNEACFFGWANGDLMPFSGFYERLELQETAVAKWRVVRTSVWQDSYDPQRHQPSSSGVYLPTQTQLALGSLSGAAGLAVGAAGFLLAFFLFVAGVLPLNREVNDLQQVTLALAERSGVNTAVCPDPSLRLLSPVDGDQVMLGTAVPILGTAQVVAAARYRVEVRLADSTDWLLVDDFTRDNTLGTLVTWDTTPHRPGAYELRLTAVDRNNVRLADSPVCQLTIQLTP